MTMRLNAQNSTMPEHYCSKGRWNLWLICKGVEATGEGNEPLLSPWLAVAVMGTAAPAVWQCAARDYKVYHGK